MCSLADSFVVMVARRCGFRILPEGGSGGKKRVKQNNYGGCGGGGRKGRVGGGVSGAMGANVSQLHWVPRPAGSCLELDFGTFLHGDCRVIPRHVTPRWICGDHPENFATPFRFVPAGGGPWVRS